MPRGLAPSTSLRERERSPPNHVIRANAKSINEHLMHAKTWSRLNHFHPQRQRCRVDIQNVKKPSDLRANHQGTSIIGLRSQSPSASMVEETIVEGAPHLYRGHLSSPLARSINSILNAHHQPWKISLQVVPTPWDIATLSLFLRPP